MCTRIVWIKFFKHLLNYRLSIPTTPGPLGEVVQDNCQSRVLVGLMRFDSLLSEGMSSVVTMTVDGVKKSAVTTRERLRCLARLSGMVADQRIYY